MIELILSALLGLVAGYLIHISKKFRTPKTLRIVLDRPIKTRPPGRDMLRVEITPTDCARWDRELRNYDEDDGPFSKDFITEYKEDVWYSTSWLGERVQELKLSEEEAAFCYNAHVRSIRNGCNAWMSATRLYERYLPGSPDQILE